MADPVIASGSGTPEQNPFLKLDDTSNRQVLGLSPSDVTIVGNQIESQLNGFDQIQKERPLTTQEQSDLEKVLLQKQQLLEAVSKEASFSTCFARETTGKSWTFKEAAKCASIAGSPLYLWSEQLLNQERSLPDPCGESTLAKVSVELTRFFKTLKSIKKYGELYIYGTVNKLAKIRDLIAATSEIIAAVLKILVERIRSWLMEQIRRAIEAVMDLIFNTLGSMIKDALIDEIVKAIMCKFDDIIKGLSKLVTEFLFALVQNVVNPVFCAVDQFVNSLINNLAAQIDRAIAPLLASINDVLGGVVQVAGSVFQAIDFVLGFEQFLCTAPDCPKIKSYTGSDGPTKSETDDFNNFLNVPDSGQVIGAATGWINNFAAFGTTLGDAPTIGLNCDTNPFQCGPPQIEIFGGGGVGATARAVVNRLGQIIGADMSAFGSGYTSPPYVTFYDTCGKGSNASGYSVINDDGEVIKIVIVNSGVDYPNTVTGLDEFGNPIIPGTNTGGTGGGGTTTTTNPNGTVGVVTTYGGNPIPPLTPEVEVAEYVACLDEIQVISTGIGYKQTDSISITPDIPNLQASVKLTEEGQIIAITVLNSPCGLNEIPEITINSATGVGAVFRPTLSVQRVEDFDSAATFDPKKLVRVIDCVGK